MVTFQKLKHVVDGLLVEAVGLSSDKKPTENIARSSKFKETDTGKEFLFGDGTWYDITGADNGFSVERIRGTVGNPWGKYTGGAFLKLLQDVQYGRALVSLSIPLIDAGYGVPTEARLLPTLSINFGLSKAVIRFSAVLTVPNIGGAQAIDYSADNGDLLQATYIRWSYEGEDDSNNFIRVEDKTENFADDVTQLYIVRIGEEDFK